MDMEEFKGKRRGFSFSFSSSPALSVYVLFVCFFSSKSYCMIVFAGVWDVVRGIRWEEAAVGSRERRFHQS